MKCMYAQIRPRFMLSSEGVLGGMEFEPMLTPREKSPLPKMSPEEDRTRDTVDSEPKHYQLSYSGPLSDPLEFGRCKGPTRKVKVTREESKEERIVQKEGNTQGELGELFVGCLTSQQHASVSQGRICSDNFTCCHTEIEVADQTFSLTQSQYTDTGPTSPSADPITPGAWQGSHWSANF